MNLKKGDRIGIKTPTLYPGVFPVSTKQAIALVERVANTQIICKVDVGSGESKTTYAIAVDFDKVEPPF